MTRDQIFRQTSVDLFFCPFLLSISRQLEKKIFRQKSYGMDLSFLSSELLNSYISGQGTIPAKLLSIFFLLVIFFWTGEHFPTKEYSDKSLNVVFLPTIFFWHIWTDEFDKGSNFPTKVYTAFLLPVVSFFLFWTLEQQISQKRKILTKVWTSFFFQLFSSEPIYIFRIRGIKFADKTLHCFPSSDRFYPLQSIKISDNHENSLIVHFVLWKCPRSQSFRGLRLNSHLHLNSPYGFPLQGLGSAISGNLGGNFGKKILATLRANRWWRSA